MFVPMIFLLGLLAAIFWASSRPSSNPAPKQSALEIAKRRYARGEITKEEYDKLRADIQ